MSVTASMSMGDAVYVRECKRVYVCVRACVYVCESASE